MNAGFGALLLGVPLLFLIWHVWKTDGKRPDSYTDIHDRPIIPAVIIDINMPFSSMVVFMTKLALAALPAIILIVIAVIFLVAALSAGGLGYMPGRF